MNIYIEHLNSLYQEGKLDEALRTAAKYMTSDVPTKQEHDEIIDFFLKILPEDKMEKLNRMAAKARAKEHY